MQTSHKIPEQDPEKPSWFEIIYKAAKEKNAEIISAILPKVSIDVVHGSEDSPVSKLAYEKDIEAVNFLRTKFNASLRRIVSGYAQGNHVAEVNDVLKLAETPADLFPLWRAMASGYARGKHVDAASAVVKLAKTPDEQLELWKAIAFGYARDGNVTEVNKILKLEATPLERLDFLQHMVGGYAQGKHQAEVNDLQHLAEDSYEQLALRTYAIRGYAIAGHEEEANNVLNKAPPFEQPNLLEAMIHSYAQGGHAAAVNKTYLLAENYNIPRNLWQAMAYGFALGGHIFAAKYVLLLPLNPINRLTLWQEIAKGYALGGHVVAAKDALRCVPDYDQLTLWKNMALGYARERFVGAANNVLKQEMPHTYRLLLSKIIATNLGKTAFLNEHNSLQTLTSFDPSFQNDIAKESKDSLKTDVNLPTLVPKATKLHKIMKTQMLSFNQAMNWIQPEMQIWLLQGPQIIYRKHIPVSIFLSISTYLLSDTHRGIIDLSNRLTLATCSQRFFNNLRENNQLLSYQLIRNPKDSTLLNSSAVGNRRY